MSDPTVSAGRAGRGLFTGTRNGALALLGSGRTRLELLGNELKEEKLRAVRLLLWSQMHGVLPGAGHDHCWWVC
jgi:uncharacterized membrane protein YqjE